MLVFATEFRTAQGVSAEDFLDVCRNWLIGSPRYPWDAGDFEPKNTENEVQEFTKGVFHVSTLLADNDGARMAAMQHRHSEEGNVEWVTELVGGETPDGLLASVRVHCTSLVTGAEVPWARKPYIVRQIIQELGGGNDGGLKVGETPHFLSTEDLNIAASALTGRLANRLPVVYVSAGMDGRPQLNVRNLAKWLSGMAHVVVEPSREFSFRLMDEVDNVNAYGGAIGIYWPDGTSSEKTFVGTRGPEPTARFIETRVQDALCHSQPTDLSTWMAVKALTAGKRLQSLRESGTENIDEWVEAFEEENATLRAQLAEAQAQVGRLSAQTRAANSQQGTSDLFPVGTESDLFPGERAEIVQTALNNALANTSDDSRARHVLSDLISENSIRMRESLADSVKALLQDKMTIGTKDISELNQLGFSVSDDGKHYKAVYRDDPRYTFTLHKTASDHRAPKNLASTINRTLFK